MESRSDVVRHQGELSVNEVDEIQGRETTLLVVSAREGLWHLLHSYKYTC